MNKLFCTRCNKELSDLWIKVRLDTQVERVREDQTVEQVENSFVSSTETLCPECFERFCDIIDTGMQNV